MHSHHDHNHSHDHSNDLVKNIQLAFFLNLIFALAEFIGGLYINSVAVLADSLHDIGDSISLGFSWYFEKLAKRERNGKYSYGFKRFSLLGAVVNAVILIVGSVFVLQEAIARLQNPEPTNVQGMFVFAIVGIVINGIAAFRMRSGKTMNAKVLTWHLIEDILGWVAVLVVSVVMMFVDLPILDPILSIGLSLFVLYNVTKALIQTISLFLQAVPGKVDIEEIERRVLELDRVIGMHHTHVWSLDGDQHVLTTHIVLEEGSKSPEIRVIKKAIKDIASEFNCQHTTVEFEYYDSDCSMP